MRSADRVRFARVAALALLAACRVEVGGSQSSSPSPASVVMEVDTLRAGCPERPPGLRLPEPADLGVDATRLLPAGDGLLVVAREGGLHLHAGDRTERLLEGGRDYALLGGRLVRLEKDRIEVFDYPPTGVPILRSTLPAQSHDSSIALLERGAFVHSAFNERALILRRSIRSGAVEGALLPVERDLLRTLLLGGPERLHEDEGILVGSDPWLLHVPFVRDPVQALQTETRRRWVLELAGGRRGEVRLERKTRRDVQPCPDCTRLVEVRGQVSFVPLYAGAAVRDGVFWILGLDPAGATRATLFRVAVDVPAVRAWRLVFPTTPGALAVWRDSLAIAAGPDLWRLALPAPASGAWCAAVGSGLVFGGGQSASSREVEFDR